MRYMKEYVIYILHCADGSYYTGLTSNLAMRVWQHNNAIFNICYTVKRRPVYLVYTAVFYDVHDAIAWERKIKRKYTI